MSERFGGEPARRRALNGAVDATLLVVVVAVLLAPRQPIPPADLGFLDSVRMGRYTLRIARHGPMTVFDSLANPVLRYVPGLVVLVLTAGGEPTVREAIVANGVAVQAVELVGTPLAVYLLAREGFGRATARWSLVALAGLHVALLGYAVPGDGLLAVGVPRSGAVAEVAAVVRRMDDGWFALVPRPWHDAFVVLAPLAGWWCLRHPDVSSRWAGLPLGALAVALSISWFRLGSYVDRLLTAFSYVDYWYFGLAVPVVVTVAWATIRATDPDREETLRSAVGVGLLLGVVANLQLGQAALAAAGVATALAVHREWRALGVAAGTAMVAVLPTAVVVARTLSFHRRAGSGIVATTAGAALLVGCVVAVVAAGVRHAGPIADRYPAETTLVAVLAGGLPGLVALSTGTHFWRTTVPATLGPLVVVAVVATVGRGVAGLRSRPGA